MGFREMGKWARGAMAGAALFAGEAATNEAAAATPAEMQEQAELQKSVEEYDTARDGELTSWVADFNVKGLKIDRIPVKGGVEYAHVLVGSEVLGEVSGTPRKISQENLRVEVSEMLTAKGYRVPTVERAASEQKVEQESKRVPLAEEVSYRDQAKTMELMQRWGVTFDGYSLTMAHEVNSDPIIAGGDPNEKLTFSHDGEDTIIVTCVEKDGDISILKITKGIAEM